MSKAKRVQLDAVRWPGIYVYKSAKRKHQGRPDVCYHINYRLDRKLIWEKVGWKSEGYTPAVAAEIRAQRIKTARHDNSVLTQKEIRQLQAQKNLPFDYIAEKYFEQRGGTESALNIDQCRYKKHVSPVIGKKPIEKICPLDLAKINRNMQGPAPASVWDAFELVRRISNYGFKAGISDRLKFVVEMPKRDNQKVEFLQVEEFARLVEVLEVWPNRAAARMLTLAMFTGMRRGEIFKLEKKDVDFIHEILTLRDPKGGTTASIPMNEVARRVIEKQIQDNLKAFPESAFIFPGTDGKKRKECSAAGRIKKEADLPKDFRMFHGLRHHFAVTLANSGKYTLDMIRELLTHKSVEMTMRYAQFLPGTKKEYSAQAAEILQEQAKSGKILFLPERKAENDK